MRKKKNNGFTLIEMIVVIVIIAILAAIAVPAVMKYIDDARDTKFIAATRPIFNDAQIETAKAYSLYGNDGTTVTMPGFDSPQKVSTAQYLDLYLQTQYSEVAVGDYSTKNGVVSSFFLYYDNQDKPNTIDSSISSHQLTKFAVTFRSSDYHTIIVVFRSNETARVFDMKDSKDQEEIFDENSDWFIDFAGGF